MAYLRSGLKYFAVGVLAVWGRLKLKSTSRPTLIILTYHRILPSHHPDRQFEQPGMVTSPEALQGHIRLMKRLGAVPTHLDDWLAKRSRDEPVPRLSVAFTFDDGWRDNFDYAYPILKAENAPATIFLVTKMLDTDRTFWPEQILRILTSTAISKSKPELQWLVPYLPNGEPTGSPLTLEEADQVIGRLKDLDDRTLLDHLERVQASRTSANSDEETRAILNTQELKEMAVENLFRFGAHTQNHFRLNRVDCMVTLRKEILGCLTDLERFGDAAVPIFCYPNGDITGEGQRLVQEHYSAACTTKTGWNSVDTDSFDLHRFNLHDGNSATSRHLLATIGRGIL